MALNMSKKNLLFLMNLIIMIILLIIFNKGYSKFTRIDFKISKSEKNNDNFIKFDSFINNSGIKNIINPSDLVRNKNNANMLIDNFKLNHKNIIQKTSDLKLVFNIDVGGGYCNKLYSFISSLLIALLTKSALIIKWEHIDKHIEEPLYLSFSRFNDNNEFNHQYKKDTIHHQGPSYYCYRKNKNMDEHVKTTIPNNTNRILYDSICPFFFELCSNPIYYDVFLQYGLAKQETIDKARVVFKNLTQYSNDVKMRVFLQIGLEVGGSILNIFWKPKKEIQDLINFYHKTHFQGNYVIGLQIRIEFLQNNLKFSDFKNETQFFDKIINQFILCALDFEINLLQDQNFFKKYKSIKWFVISDNMKIIEKISDLYPNKVIKTNGTVLHVFFDPNGYTKAILDNELLSKCDELILSSGSSFGFTAALRKQSLPLYIDMIKQKCSRTDFADLPTTGSAALI